MQQQLKTLEQLYDVKIATVHDGMKLSRNLILTNIQKQKSSKIFLPHWKMLHLQQKKNLVRDLFKSLPQKVEMRMGFQNIFSILPCKRQKPIKTQMINGTWDELQEKEKVSYLVSVLVTGQLFIMRKPTSKNNVLGKCSRVAFESQLRFLVWCVYVIYSKVIRCQFFPNFFQCFFNFFSTFFNFFQLLILKFGRDSEIWSTF